MKAQPALLLLLAWTATARAQLPAEHVHDLSLPVSPEWPCVWPLGMMQHITIPRFTFGLGAYHRETVVQAVEKLELTLNRIWRQTHAQTLRLIVGGGLIRDAVLAELYFKKSRGTVLDFSEENRGSLIIRIR
jgi:hypothetical protein